MQKKGVIRKGFVRMDPEFYYFSKIYVYFGCCEPFGK
jgi:hypothetical protein